MRDLLLGREPEDYDVATSATPDIVLGMFPRTFAVGAHFGVVLVDAVGARTRDRRRMGGREPRWPRSGRMGCIPMAAIRTRCAIRKVPRRMCSGAISRSMVCCSTHCVGADLLDELLRSSTALRSAVIDYVGGLADSMRGSSALSGGRSGGSTKTSCACCGRCGSRRASDLRSIRQPTRLCGRMAPRIRAVSRERVRDELTKMLTEGHARRAFELLDETGLLAEVLPELARMKGVEQRAAVDPEGGDVWVHTLLLLEQLETGCAPTLAWGALLHDVGKPPTFRVAPDRIRFDGHVEVGVAMGADICAGAFAFRMMKRAKILALIENHMRFADAPRMKESTLKRFFRLEHFDEHLALHKMDCLAAHGNLDIWNFVRDRYHTMPAETVQPQPIVTGRELIAAGYVPGPQFKEMLRAAEDAQLEGTIATADEALLLLQQRFGRPVKT